MSTIREVAYDVLKKANRPHDSTGNNRVSEKTGRN